MNDSESRATMSGEFDALKNEPIDENEYGLVSEDRRLANEALDNEMELTAEELEAA